ncbi:MAG: Fic family protein [Egibacteraceae bacterium]
MSVASLARALIDNARESHARAGRPARTLSRYELERWIDTLASDFTDDRLARLRSQVEQVAELLGEHHLGEVVSSLLGVAQRTRPDVKVSYPALVARRDGAPVDTRRLELFDDLVAALRDRAPEPMSTSEAGEPRRAVLPFFEAYFSNFIEGTEFEVSEAVEIVFYGKIPQARPADAHDILGTYQLVSDPAEMATVPVGGGEHLLQLLRSRHATIMQARPDKRPGQFKTVANRVGSRVFVAPEEVIGTLQAGWERVGALDDPFARAVTAMFVVSEVHPFDDGNGRVARVMMNAELVAAGQVRIVIPTVYRNNYLAALRGMSANGRPDALIAVLAFAQRWTSQIDWSSVETVMGELEATHALRDATDAEAEGIRLRLPARV